MIQHKADFTKYIAVVILLWANTVLARVQGTIGQIDTLLTPGYYINFVDKSPIKLQTDDTSPDPFHTFKGCRVSTVESNFKCRLNVTARATSNAGGDWKAEIYPYLIPIGDTNVRLCIKGTNVQIQKLKGGDTGVKVAEIRIEVFAQ